jgi:hypothetical protein
METAGKLEAFTYAHTAAAYVWRQIAIASADAHTRRTSSTQSINKGVDVTTRLAKDFLWIWGHFIFTSVLQTNVCSWPVTVDFLSF